MAAVRGQWCRYLKMAEDGRHTARLVSSIIMFTNSLYTLLSQSKGLLAVSLILVVGSSFSINYFWGDGSFALVRLMRQPHLYWSCFVMALGRCVRFSKGCLTTLLGGGGGGVGINYWIVMGTSPPLLL